MKNFIQSKNNGVVMNPDIETKEKEEEHSQSDYLECKYYQEGECNAPICPLNDKSIKKAIWFPNEEICKRRQFSKINWIVNQKKINHHGTKHINNFFTAEMLNRKMIVRKNIKGLNPDQYKYEQEKKWILKHPEKKPISEEKKKELIKRLKPKEIL